MWLCSQFGGYSMGETAKLMWELIKMRRKNSELRRQKNG
jgi:hypothetical protein